MWTVDQVNHFFEAEHNRINLIPVLGVEVESSNINLSLEHAEYKWCCVNDGIDLMIWNQQKQGLINFHQMLTEKLEKLKLSTIFKK